MTEWSAWWTTSGSPSGHQETSYTQTHLSTIGSILGACGGFEGIAPGYNNELNGSAPSANTWRVASGGAIVDGKIYNNSANEDITIPSAVGGGNTRIDRIVVRATWASFQAILTRIAGTDASSPTPPAITQTSGTTYDIMLYQVLVDTAGTVTLQEDERSFARVPVFGRERQGGSPAAWSTGGTTNYAITDVFIQVGSYAWSGASANQGEFVITFPAAFNNNAMFFFATRTQSNHNAIIAYDITVSSGTAITVRFNSNINITSFTVSWMGIADPA